jgi:hypothetical protein
VPIVERGQRFHGLTPDGERVLTWAKVILDNWESLQQEIATRRNTAGAFPLTDPLVEHSVGLVAVDRDPISPLVQAAFECARDIEPPVMSRPR